MSKAASVTEMTPQTSLNGVTFTKRQFTVGELILLIFYQFEKHQNLKESSSWTQAILVSHNIKKAYLASKEADNVMNYVQKVSVSVVFLFNLQVLS